MAVVYTTAAFSRHERVNGGYDRVPTGVVHAKTWGEAKALCGADSATWPKYYGTSFFRLQGSRCRRCTSAALAMARRDLAQTN